MFAHQNQELNSLADALKRLPEPGEAASWVGLPAAAKAYAAARFYKHHRIPMAVIFASSKEAEAFMEDLIFFMGEDAESVIHFPAYNIMPASFMSYHNETAAARVNILYRLMESGAPPVVVTCIKAAMHRTVPKRVLSEFAELILAQEEIDRDRLIEKMIAGGYTRTAIVEEPGDFSVRGGIVDIFSPMYADPLRIEFFGDLVDTIRLFSPANQRTTDVLEEAVLLPAREVILEKSALTQVLGRVRKAGADHQIPVKQIRHLVEQIKTEGAFPGLESLLPFVYDSVESVLDYFGPDAVFFLDEPAAAEQAAVDIEKQLAKTDESARLSGKFFVDPFTLYVRWPELQKRVVNRPQISFKTLSVSDSADPEPRTAFHFTASENAELRQQLDLHIVKDHMLAPLATHIKGRMALGQNILIVCRSKSQKNRLASLLEAYDIFPEPFESNWWEAAGRRFESAAVRICVGALSSGFSWEEESITVISGDDIFGSRRPNAGKRRKDVSSHFLTLEDLKQGDLVVHEMHGIGEYNGLAKLKIDGHANDFLLIVYRDDDRLYLPVERMNMVQKYIGVEGVTPVLDKMGGKSWERITLRVKRSAEKMAGELLALYATRKVENGHAFSGVDRYFQDFEAAFPYEETADQMKAVEDVISDMQQASPMDRLVCGDVGYGKTEVALRAAFFAVNNNKQAAVLVPTTVLAEQHYETFKERFKRYPVEIASLSRFRSQKEQRDIIEKIKSGHIDIVIGTHRLLQKDVAFKDLGLMILDEEQRFGVKHKEVLKKIRKTVDVLTLTATPIPRTLQMSLLGIRDVSVISTPPEHRRAIITYILEFDEAVIADAVRRELERNGQIFFVHNHINTIDAVAGKLKKMVPELRLGVAHGRMQENELEEIMFSFASRDIDMLVCTTIIESGLDIPAANTIIVNRADRFGLAQMYQLRGRVGRSTEQAYAYLIIPAESTLTRDAQKRLKVLMEHSDLGSGFQIAMNDLRIRGAGTILGASQSGHIAAVGYDMFLKLMGDAISEIKGEPVKEPLDPEINLTMSAFIPEAYVPDIDQRLALYRRLARMEEVKEITDIKAELQDRFGALPAEATNLLYKIVLKISCIKAGVKRLDLAGEMLALQFSREHQQSAGRIADMIKAEPDRYRLNPDGHFKAGLTARTMGGQLRQSKNILKEIARHVNA